MVEDVFPPPQPPCHTLVSLHTEGSDCPPACASHTTPPLPLTLHVGLPLAATLFLLSTIDLTFVQQFWTNSQLIFLQSDFA